MLRDRTRRTRRCGWLVAVVLSLAGMPLPPTAPVRAAAAGAATGTPTETERVETVTPFGDARFHGSTGATALARSTIDIEPTRDGGGYWLVARDGGVFAYGNATFHGSTGAITLYQPVVGMAATPSGQGYWLVAADGGIFAFGDARFLGSMGATALNEPVVGMASTTTGNGYWLVAADGGIFAFGDARFAGSIGAVRLHRPVVAMAAPPSGQGYWLVAADGGVFAFGDAPFRGSIGTIVMNPLRRAVTGMAATPSGQGYWLVAADGGIFAFGDARFAGARPGRLTDDLVVGMAATPSGGGYWLATTGPGFFPGFWPEATPAAALALQRRVDAGAETWRRDAGDVARAFAREVAGWSILVGRVIVRGSTTDGWTSQVTFQPLIGEGARVPGPFYDVDLIGLRGAERPVWFVTRLLSDVFVDAPLPESFVASPLRVAGSGQAFEATLHIRVTDDNGRVLHPRPGQPEGFVMAGAGERQPFEGRLVFSRPSAPAGRLTVAADSGAGPSPAVTILRLRF